MHTSTDTVHTVDITYTAVQLPDAMQQSAQQGARRADPTGGQQLWLVHVTAPGVVMLWLGGGGAGKHVEATAEVCNEYHLLHTTGSLVCTLFAMPCCVRCCHPARPSLLLTSRCSKNRML